MATPTSASRAFFGSLLFLVAALGLFLFLIAPWHRGDGRVVVHDDRPTPVPQSHKVAVAPAAKTQTKVTPVPEATRPVAVAYDAEAEVQKAINLIDAGDMTTAVSVLEGVLKRDPRNEQALVELAMIYLLDLKQPDLATSYLQRVVDVNPTNQIVLSELVSLYEEQSKLEEGLAFLTEMQAKHPESADVSFGLGQLLTLQGRDTDAVPYLEKAAQSPDNQVRALKDLGEAYSRAGDPEKAIDSFKRAIASQEKEIAAKQSQGIPVQYNEERLSYTKMDEVRELIRTGETDQAQQLLDDVRTVMPSDEAVTALQESLNRRRAG